MAATKGITGDTLNEMIGKVLKVVDKEHPASTDPLERLERVRAIQQEMSRAANEAAEKVWPGWTEIFQEMLKKETHLMAKIGACNVGVA